MSIEVGNAAAHLLHQNPTKCPPTSPDTERLPESHRVWDVRKGQADDVADLYAKAKVEKVSKHAAKVAACSQTVILSDVINRETGELGHKAESWKCRERHCPICQSARARKLHRAFSAALPAIMAEVPEGRFLLLTLTIRNCPIAELRKTLSDMGKAWRRLTARDDFRIVKGWVRGTEVTRSDTGEAHPHFHALLLVPPYYFAGKSYIKHERWIELWQEAARLNYTPSVDIRRVKTPESGLSEAIKAATYSVKTSALVTDAAWFHEFHLQVSGLRFLATGGVIKAALGVKAEGETDDIAEGPEPEGEESGKRVFGWNRPRRQYRLKGTAPKV
jgi:plasmid rolling circle replication initiator protein Rep